MPEARQQQSGSAEIPPEQPDSVTKSPTEPSWRTGIAQKVAALTCLIAAAALVSYLVNIPVGEVGGQFPATVRARAEIVSFDNPGLVDGGIFSFGYTAPTEAEKVLLDAYFDNAHLSPQTLQALHALRVDAPSSSASITYLTSTVSHGACSTQLEAQPTGPHLSSIQFSQTSSDSLEGYRSLGASFDGTDTEVVLTSQGALQDILSPCRVELSVGDWKQVTAGFVPIKILVPAGAHFRFRWQNLNEKSSTWENKGAALPLVQFGSLATDEFTASAIKISTVNLKNGATNAPRLEALGEKQSPLTVESFAINKNQLGDKGVRKGEGAEGWEGCHQDRRFRDGHQEPHSLCSVRRGKAGSDRMGKARVLPAPAQVGGLSG
ncbi:MAG TPA: hypothetical protein VII95_04240 [Terriglobales bacterium]|jgi:hypothetical protein